ncbi:MAG: permease [Chitinophaga sp.]|nr:permease [Chitinophaga sp.]PJE45831.1 MAG: permease [Sediminibacterium sp.] [Sediminibacterium sp. FEMGT703S]
MQKQVLNWLIFSLLCIIWGSSFILMKGGMNVLSPYQVASIRIISAGLVLLPFALKALRNIPKEKRGVVVLSGLLGSFFPAYLFCIAETKIDSALAGIMNALTPLFVIITGISFFQLKVKKLQLLGIIVGFIGLSLLVAAGSNISLEYFSYSLLVLLATLLYGINVNMVGKHMQGIGSIEIASMAFVFLLIPCLIILYFTGFFALPLSEDAYLLSVGASAVLGIFGTAVASVLFYMLVKRAGALFASMVTYGIPFVAIGWGIWGGEQVNLIQVTCCGIILIGVYLANKK